MDEVFILRAPPALAERLRRLLAEDGAASSSHAAAELELVFSEDGRTGHLRVGADSYPAKLMDLPTKAESWKTLDDVNLVKAADIGQIIVVAPPGAALPTEEVCLNGITVAMRCVPRTDRGFSSSLTRAPPPPLCDRDAQRTHFRKPLEYDKKRISTLEADLARLIAGGALNRPGEVEVTLTEEWV